MNTDPDSSRTGEPPAGEQPSGGGALDARLVRYANAPDELTVFPREVPEEARATTWLTAQEGSFVDLESHR